MSSVEALLIVGTAGLCICVILRLLGPRRPHTATTRIENSSDIRLPSHNASRRETLSELEGSEPVHASDGLWENIDYFWVVLCKNRQFHHRSNLLYAHKIPLGQTDTVSPSPITKAFAVKCDQCGKEYVYTPSEVMRWEMQAPEGFEPHPLFRT